MNKTQETAVVAVAGLATSVATAFANLIVLQLTGFNVFSFSWFFIVPVGALICGFLAASGYFFAAKALHIRPTRLLLVQMVVVAALTQCLIYWVEYRWATVDGASVSAFISFREYLDLTMTSQRIVSSPRLAVPPSPMLGSWGYALAGLDFIGFVLGGLSGYIWLKDLPNCGPCGKYLKALVKKKDAFADREGFFAYYNQEFSHPVDSAEFAAFVGKVQRLDKGDKPFIELRTDVLGCPSCGNQSVLETATMLQGGSWKDVPEWRRLLPMPEGIDVRKAYCSRP